MSTPLSRCEISVDTGEHGPTLSQVSGLCLCARKSSAAVLMPFLISVHAPVTSVYVCYTADMHEGPKLGTSVFSLSWNVQMRDRYVVLNWILSERVTAAAAPLYQNIPVGNLTGYTVDIRVTPLAHAIATQTACLHLCLSSSSLQAWATHSCHAC